MAANNFRQSYTLRFHTIHELAVLAAWENRTPSQQVDHLIHQSFVAYRESLDSERRAALDADVLVNTGGV